MGGLGWVGWVGLGGLGGLLWLLWLWLWLLWRWPSTTGGFIGNGCGCGCGSCGCGCGCGSCGGGPRLPEDLLATAVGRAGQSGKRARVPDRMVGISGRLPPESTHKKKRIFIIIKKHVFKTARKHTHLCGEMRANFGAGNIYALLNVTESCHKKSKTIFSDMVDTTVLAPTPSGPECFGAAGAPVAVAAVAGVEALLPGPRTLL